MRTFYKRKYPAVNRNNQEFIKFTGEAAKNYKACAGPVPEIELLCHNCGNTHFTGKGERFHKKCPKCDPSERR